jgi:hypothetical protein
MPPPPLLPTEVLACIFAQCASLANVVLASRRFAHIAYNISRFWSFVRLGPRQFTPDGLDHLTCRLDRVHSETSLYIVIGPVAACHERILVQMCAIITNAVHSQSLAVDQLDIQTHMSRLAEIVFCAVPITNLHKLSISVDSVFTYADNESISLSNSLTQALESDELLALEELSLSGCIPIDVQEDGMPLLMSLCTLHFDQSKIGLSHHPYLEALFLTSSPNLRTISIRQAVTYDTEESEDLGLPPLHLAQLSSLELTTGLACQLLPVLQAVGLEELTLDGSFADEDEDIVPALQHTSFYHLSHLALTSIGLDEQAWNWLFFQGPPFPHLQRISLRAIDQPCGFNNTLLYRHAREPLLPLRQLSFLRCQLELDGGALVHIFKAAVERHEACLIEYDDYLGLGSQQEQELRHLGVQLRLH